MTADVVTLQTECVPIDGGADVAAVEPSTRAASHDVVVLHAELEAAVDELFQPAVVRLHDDGRRDASVGLPSGVTRPSSPHWNVRPRQL